MTLWLYLHFPQLQLDNFYQDVNQPVVIVDGRQHQVRQCNAAASAHGIRTSMGLGTAAALCQSLLVYPYQQAAEQQKLNELAQWLYLKTSDISLYAPDGLLLKVSDMLTLYGGLAQYWQMLSQHLASCAVRYQYATAYSPLAARTLARHHGQVLSADPEQLRQFLRGQSLTALELNRDHHEKLTRLGITQLGQLLALPMADLARRFDQQLSQCIGRLLEQWPDPQRFFHPPEQFCQSLELLYEVNQLPRLEKPLLRLLRPLQQFLQWRELLALQLELSLILRDGPAKLVTIGAAQGENQANQWLTLALLKLESVTITNPVIALTLRCQSLVPKQAATTDLLSKQQATLSTSALLSLLQAKLGENAITQPQYYPDHRPERANQLQPLSHASFVTQPQSSERPARLRPSLLLPTPQPLQEQVELLHGPERIQTGWWEDDSGIRDYFIARTPNGRWLWLFRTEQRAWFIHGWFC